MSTVLITCKNHGLIPLVNKIGPFLNKIPVSEETAAALKKLGYDINIYVTASEVPSDGYVEAEIEDENVSSEEEVYTETEAEAEETTEQEEAQSEEEAEQDSQEPSEEEAQSEEETEEPATEEEAPKKKSKRR